MFRACTSESERGGGDLMMRPSAKKKPCELYVVFGIARLHSAKVTSQHFRFGGGNVLQRSRLTRTLRLGDERNHGANNQHWTTHPGWRSKGEVFEMMYVYTCGAASSVPLGYLLVVCLRK